MAFDQSTRNRLARFVSDTRSLLAEEFTRQLQNDYGLDPATGEVTDLAKLKHLDDARRETARLLRETMEHYLASADTDTAAKAQKAQQEALNRIVREQAFTVLNRFCALRMSEARGLLIESIAKGYQSKGFQLYQRLAGTALGETGDVYRVFIFSVFDEFAVDLPVLFDRFSPQGRLFPRETALLAVLEQINHPDIDSLWAEDETIGWIYQYFNSVEERRQMRAESQAPRNSRELAVRNQFFTPRYVVEFLTDNTLGRIWYEMTQGQTALKDSCRYLVRRPNEVFLAENEQAPEQEEPIVDLSQEVLLKQPVYIPHRSKKDPREIRILDPACGSGHFLLYAFDLLIQIYHEAWCDPDLGPDLWRDLGWESKHWKPEEKELVDPNSVRIRPDELISCYECEATPPARDAYFVAQGPLMPWGGSRPMIKCQGCAERARERSESYIVPLPAFDYANELGCARFRIQSGHDMITGKVSSHHAFDYKTSKQVDEHLFDRLEDAQGTVDGLACLRRQLPELILCHNLHGIDIDPRAAQIAALALWLRAQRYWHEHDFRPQDRPQIQRSNIVCAEPMPGEADMLEEFLKGLRDDQLESLIHRVLNVPANQQVRATARMAEALCDLVRTVWQEMKLAGEVGSLLKIKESLADAIAKGKDEWIEKAPLFRVMEFSLTEETQAAPKVRYYKNVPGEEEDFWNRAEALVLAALKDYAEHAQGTEASRRRMFAQDAVRGFAFIDLLQKQFDVILMNPPFGSPSTNSRPYLKNKYSDTKDDLDAAFVDHAADLLTRDGNMGGIFNRTQFFKGYLQNWRQRHMLADRQIDVAADLGTGVLDTALVEAACYTTRHHAAGDWQSIYFRLLGSEAKGSDLEIGVGGLIANDNEMACRTYIRPNTAFFHLPSCRLSYWVSDEILTSYTHFDTLEGNYAEARQGLITADNDRFLRLAWEISSELVAQTEQDTFMGRPWVRYAKGGNYSPYYGNIHLVVNWSRGGYEIRNYYKPSGKLASRPQNMSYYFKPSLTYTERTTSGFSPRILPKGCIFDCKGPVIHPLPETDSLWLLGLCMTRTFSYFVELSVAAADSAARQYTQSIVGSVPVSPGTPEARTLIADYVRAIWDSNRKIASFDETDPFFIAPRIVALIPGNQDTPFLSLVGEALIEREDMYLQIIHKSHEIERLVADSYSLSDNALEAIQEQVGLHPGEIGIRGSALPCKNDDLPANTLRSDDYDIDYSQHHSIQSGRAIHYASSILETLVAATGCSAERIVSLRRAKGSLPQRFAMNCATRVLSYCVGTAFGRWDIRPVVAGRCGDLPVNDPFDPLPLQQPGMEGETDLDDEVLLPWEGRHAEGCLDSESLLIYVRNVLEFLNQLDASKVEGEICQHVGCHSFSEYLADPYKFFEDHLSAYSKSRRVAPIYWPLSTPSGSYALWLYYHRLTDQTLYTCVNDFVDPKLKQVAEEATRLRSKANRSSTEEKELERLTDLQLELKDFRDELLRIAKFWKPNLNDGVQITAAPLWKLFQHRQWQARLKETWEKLEAGDYDWAHLALFIWPDRVVRSSHKDRSYAIAHDLEDKLWHEVEVKKTSRSGRVTTKLEWHPRDLTENELNKIIAEVKTR